MRAFGQDAARRERSAYASEDAGPKKIVDVMCDARTSELVEYVCADDPHHMAK